MRPTERDFLLFLLAIASGAADGWSYTGLGHAFVANMTGNTVLLGLAVFGKGDLLGPFISIVCYAFGVVLASFLVRKTREGAIWGRQVSWVLLLESFIMAAAQIGWVVLHTSTRPRLPIHFLLGAVAVAIGIQSGAMLRLRVPGVVTTYITGTWTNLMTNLYKFAHKEKNKPAPEKIQFEERLFMQSGILAVYFLSAVLTGWLFVRLPIVVGALPAVSTITVAVYSLMRNPRSLARRVIQPRSLR